ncbi:intradiol ring-cleavage dioxygenase [Micromonospora aurantiaca (nom. illeg.)]|uniref:intradiol ring-cleavage dioxygenase n=1 Tax=Micromonospora aurantiaca (nom. illeg.) TaxID=47850 RepID=UPI003DA2AE6E
MSRTDEPRRYQGRRLPRPNDELVDQGLSFDVDTLLSRRRVLGLFGAGVAGLSLAACRSGSSNSPGSTGPTSGSSGLTEIPDETNGPYPADGTNGPDILEQSGVIRQDITSSFGTSTTKAEGIPMTLTLTVLDMVNGGAPFAGVAVYVWHCDRDGNYSMYSGGLEDENYLRGVQIADADGKVTFTSIYPACYSGRWPHIHFEVYPNQKSISDADQRLTTSQVALPKNASDTVYATTGYQASIDKFARLTLATDNVFGDDGGVHQVGTVTGDVTSGYQVSLTVPIDTSTKPTGGDAPGDGGAPPGGGAPPSGGPPPGGGTPPSGAPNGAILG